MAQRWISQIGALLLIGGVLTSCGARVSQSAQTHNAGDAPTRSESNNRCGEDFAYIPRGRFLSGSTPEERNYAYRISAEAIDRLPVEEAEAQLRQNRWFDHEPDQRQRRLAAFCISKNLITQADYQEFVLATGYHSPGITPENYQEQGFRVHSYQATRPYAWRSYQYPEDKANHPVVLISHQDALAYLTWRSQEDNVTYRLPTAEEWEKAARGLDGQYFPWGNEWQDNATNWQGSGLESTSEVGEYPLSQSIYGVEDMAGNVFEFTSTVFERDEQMRTVMKGCAWDDLPGFCRTAYRHSRPVTYRHILFGFRLVKSTDS